MTPRTIAVTVGALFIFQMISAIIGTTLTQAFTDGNPDKTALTTGVALMICSGLAVVGIGLLMYRILKGFNQKLALWYPVMRVIELAVSATCSIPADTLCHLQCQHRTAHLPQGTLERLLRPANNSEHGNRSDTVPRAGPARPRHTS
ncbi:DUF4386 family protein [Nonomuraea sp. MTCD27]|uniref:DUF4386 family protein n=1 Tax=Nonomuraea sp. MTCD27 TaxID=1676747 RepID=UPI0035C17523